MDWLETQSSEGTGHSEPVRSGTVHAGVCRAGLGVSGPGHTLGVTTSRRLIGRASVALFRMTVFFGVGLLWKTPLDAAMQGDSEEDEAARQVDDPTALHGLAPSSSGSGSHVNAC